MQVSKDYVEAKEGRQENNIEDIEVDIIFKNYSDVVNNIGNNLQCEELLKGITKITNLDTDEVEYIEWKFD